jgi:Holliday junction resolvase RusA-like endonuclease
MYTPGKTRKYEEEVWWMAHAAGIRQDCFKGMFLKVELLFATGSSLEELLHADGDNIEKAILDGLKPAFNDAYVVDMHWRKLAWIPQLVEVALEVL